MTDNHDEDLARVSKLIEMAVESSTKKAAHITEVIERLRVQRQLIEENSGEYFA